MFKYLSAAVLAASLLTANPQIEKPEPVYFGSVIADEITAIEGLFIICRIDQWPDVLGKDIPVRINGVEPAESAEQADPNDINQRISKAVRECYTSGVRSDIILRRIQRGSGFYLLADVYIGNQNLAEQLVEQGLAKKCEKIVPSFVPVIRTVVIEQTPPANTGQVRTVSDQRRQQTETAQQVQECYAASKNSKVFHTCDCRFVSTITEKNMVSFSSREEAVNSGRRPCRMCNP